jgi:hypothetical protein
MCSADVTNTKICAKYNITKITISCQKLVYFTSCNFFRLYYTDYWVVCERGIGEDLKEILLEDFRSCPVSFPVRLRKPRHVLIRIDVIHKEYLRSTNREICLHSLSQSLPDKYLYK